MAKARQRAPSCYRKSRRQAGMVRLEVRVRREDGELVRWMVRAPVDLKRLLAEAPLDGVDHERERDLGRRVEL